MKKSARKNNLKNRDFRTTGILGGIRLSKHSTRIEAIGSLDELNSFLGLLVSLNDTFLKRRPERIIRKTLKKIIDQIQNDLFVIGADLSQPLIQLNTIPHLLHHHYDNSLTPEAPENIPQITHSHIHFLEETTHHFHKQLPLIKNFILPQGNPVGALMQVVRAICRRTERRVVQLATNEEINPLILAYLNRLSDLLFALARTVNLKSRKLEIIWKYHPPETLR